MYKVDTWTNLEVWTARREHDLVRLERLSLGGQRAVHMHALLQQRVEHRHQCGLVVVPAQAELLVVVHDAAVWPLSRPPAARKQHKESALGYTHTVIRALGILGNGR